MSNLNIEKVRTDISNSNNEAKRLYNKLKINYSIYNNLLSSGNPNIINSRNVYLIDIYKIYGDNGDSGILNTIKNIDDDINSYFLSLTSNISILKSQINNFKNKMSHIVNENGDRSTLLKNNFKDLYNKQYLMNVQLFFGISILGIIITKNMFNEIK